MKSFSLYEFSGILIPGAMILFGIALIFPEIERVLLKDISLGDLGLFVLLAYAAGQIIQAIGNILENLWWKLNKGMPTNWIRIGKGGLLSPEQIKILEDQISTKLSIKLKDGIRGTDAQNWYGITRHLYAYVGNRGKTDRIEIFNAYYGLNRGMYASLAVLTVLILIFSDNKFAWITAMLAGIALYRMHRFAKNYARELFVQFLES
ncbi:MAG: hypothetical protein JRI96_11585 [Deltaproteobacteria bacterium]|nr:hypothetical protein [Deltaproteobacteria bacterium]